MTLVWLRVSGDVVFEAGGVLLARYALRLRRPPSGRALLLPAAACV